MFNGYVKSCNGALFSFLFRVPHRGNQADNQYQLAAIIILLLTLFTPRLVLLLFSILRAGDIKSSLETLDLSPRIYPADHLLNNNEGVVKMSENIIFKINDVLSHSRS